MVVELEIVFGRLTKEIIDSQMEKATGNGGRKDKRGDSFPQSTILLMIFKTNNTASFFDTFLDGIGVQWFNRRTINNLKRKLRAGLSPEGRKKVSQRQAVAKNSDIFSGAKDSRLANSK